MRKPIKLNLEFLLKSRRKQKQMRSAPKKKMFQEAKLIYPHLDENGEWTHVGKNCGCKRCPCHK